MQVAKREERRHIVTVVPGRLRESLERGGCGACQNSCQSACKTSCTVGNQACLSQNR
ncbi:MAG: six-cysteine ranthipeptide SCIFF [Desulfitobacteriaceae bacterium]|nr:six-cysteine ranthipeptide SCIFF [Desulfitobacteriaceae bacterium]